MDKSKRMNTLLVEILIVLFFFMLASTVLMDVFAHARQLSATAQARSTALEEAQNVAEQLYAADEAHEPLQEMGFDGVIRPDHGRMIWGEQARPGYGLYDRALGAVYIEGLWEAIKKSAK